MQNIVIDQSIEDLIKEAKDLLDIDYNKIVHDISSI